MELKKAFLIEPYLYEEVDYSEDNLLELEELAKSAGVQTVGKIGVALRHIDAGTFIGSGKIKEIQKSLEGVDLVIIDHEIPPSQQRNLEKELGCECIDRTEVILEVFASRAKTKEAKLQVELAEARYQLPRLKRLWTHLSRQSGGGLAVKGDGEKQLEIDKRIIKKKIHVLESEIKKVVKTRSLQRKARRKSAVPTFAIVGYTNVGKSTLLNKLSKADVLVEDKLFATLDSTVRHFVLPNNQTVLLVDTVGFIRKLPHILVAAFKSTLEEAVLADILIHVVDSSNPMAEMQAEETLKVLKELHADKHPVITVLNKSDLCDDFLRLQRLRIAYEEPIMICAKTGEGFDLLYKKMMEKLADLRVRLKLSFLESEYKKIAELEEVGFVHHNLTKYEEGHILVTADIPKTLIHRFSDFVLRIKSF